MNKEIVLFDLDRTLLDTDKTSVMHNENILKILNTSDLEKIKKLKLEYRSTLNNEREYEPEGYLRLLSKSFDYGNLDALLEVYYGDNYKFAYENAVFPEVILVLDKLQSNYRLGVYSEGTKKFQNHKFRAMNLSKYFEEDLIFIFDAKDTPEVVEKIPAGSIIVDDKERICDFLYENEIEVVWLNKKDDTKSEKYKTIHSLLELPNLLELK